MKGTSGVVVLTEKESARPPALPCISCGRCLAACPVFLNPSRLGQMAQLGMYERMAEEYHLNDCMLCGSCSYVCPSNIPLSQMFALGKAGLRRTRQRAEQERAEKAEKERAEKERAEKERAEKERAEKERASAAGGELAVKEKVVA
jgi:Na+-translocating ferredoxin:NAD+ oxidoreductase subunit C